MRELESEAEIEIENDNLYHILVHGIFERKQNLKMKQRNYETSPLAVPRKRTEKKNRLDLSQTRIPTLT